MKFGSVCSGIEAASVAWQPLGWKAQWLAEIEPFPCSLLAHHYPDTPNLGDMTKFNEWPTDDKHAIDLLCGGTPCQSFSVAGLRKGLDDPRGNLMLTFGAIAAKYRPQWLVWENVPGVLSSNGGRDFGAFLGMLGQLGYGFAYRVLDAQYFGVAQRRRRVFVVGCFGDWRSAAAVLFERHSLQGHPAPRRQAGKGTSHSLAPSLTASGRGVERTGETRGQDPVVAVEIVETLCAATGQAGAEMTPTLNCNHEAPYAMYQTAHTLRGEGFDASEDGTGRGTPMVPVIVGALCKDTFSGGMGGRPESAAAGHVLPVTFPANLSGTQCASAVDVSPALGALNPTAVALSVALRGREGGATAELGDKVQNCLRASGGGGDEAHVLAPVTAFQTRGSNLDVGDIAGTIGTNADSASGSAPMALTAMQVRRLTPVECERLQGFPDDYTAVPNRGKPAADGPRYKALGNSWAVPNVRWIGRRIDLVADLMAEKKMEIAA